MIEEVNIQGTQNVIDGKKFGHAIIVELRKISSVCVECGVSRLVYTSTYNVVFGGQEIRNGDDLEILPDYKVGAWVLCVGQSNS